jgi:hypothetical protein
LFGFHYSVTIPLRSIICQGCLARHTLAVWHSSILAVWYRYQLNRLCSTGPLAFARPSLLLGSEAARACLCWYQQRFTTCPASLMSPFCPSFLLGFRQNQSLLGSRRPQSLVCVLSKHEDLFVCCQVFIASFLCMVSLSFVYILDTLIANVHVVHKAPLWRKGCCCDRWRDVSPKWP